MPTTNDIKWFKDTFRTQVEAAVAGTPYDLDMLTAVACQETGDIWSTLRRKNLTVPQILALCVGDSIGGPARKAFPVSRQALEAAQNGPAMFALAHDALVDMSKFIPGFSKVAGNPDKFCHGYGIFQYDLQFFKESPGYFLERGYADFDVCARRAVGELKAKQARSPTLRGKTALTDLEMSQVAIAYNRGSYDPARGLKQGFKNAEGKFYGELFHEFLRLARTVPVDGQPAQAPKPLTGQAPVSPPTPVTATGDSYLVDTKAGRLMLRHDPRATAEIVAKLPDGHPVRSVGEAETNGFLKVETNLNGAHFEGYCGASFLAKQPIAVQPPTPVAAPKLPKKGAVAVWMPRKAGTVTLRTEFANAHSLNEPGQPVRKGTTVEARVAELGAIIDWLDVVNPAHRRYLPRDGQTFCNIYAHDFCHLAGIYLPRVWWKGPALVELGQGKTVEPLYDKTIEEVRANALLTWLDDFGLDFGWRRTSDLSKLQADVNLGAVGLVVACRVDASRPGHIVVVVPEAAGVRATLDPAGAVMSPVQSAAGARNVKRAAGAAQWWKDAKFAESAYWIHA